MPPGSNQVSSGTLAGDFSLRCRRWDVRPVARSLGARSTFFAFRKQELGELAGELKRGII